MHIWIVGRRSLCDNKSYPGTHEPNVPRSVESMKEDFEAPVCGACLVVLRLLTEMADEILSHRASVYPDTVRQAIRALPPSWDKEWDLDEMVGRPPFASSSVLAFWDPETALAADSYMVTELAPNTEAREQAEIAARAEFEERLRPRD
ncbi:hypothetical protein C5B93_01130 [Rathayibacter sp. AY1A2]|nr:hypothetical protein C5B93_01130 [Rathayibacter sp. AY1A2]